MTCKVKKKKRKDVPYPNFLVKLNEQTYQKEEKTKAK